MRSRHILFTLLFFFSIFIFAGKVSAVDPGIILDSQLVTDSVPTSIPTGGSRDISITFYNNCTYWPAPPCSPWPRSGPVRVRLKSLNDYWIPTERYLTRDVGIADSYTFTFTITAPPAPGNYPFEYRLENYGTISPRGFFGESISRTITVSTPTPTPTPTGGGGGPTLSVDLTAATNETSFTQSLAGLPPLNGVDLKAVVSGTATGTIRYTLYCNRADTGTNITAGYYHDHSGQTATSHQDNNACTYALPGTYKAKVIVSRGGLLAQDQVVVTVSTPTLGVALSASPSSGIAPLSSTLSATVTGTATGTINYSFWWHCDDKTKSVDTANKKCGTLTAPTGGSCVETVDIGYKCDGITANPKSSAHTYPIVGTFTPKVIVERDGASSAEARTALTVNPDNPPTASGTTVVQPNYCSFGPGGTVSWTYSDVDNVPLGTDPQTSYQVQVDDSSLFTSPEDDSGVVSSEGTSYSIPTGKLAYATRYYARVMVWDSYGISSAWSPSASFTTPIHQYPEVSFSFTPSSPKWEKLIKFNDSTLFYDGLASSSAAHTWTWDFDCTASGPLQECDFSSSALQHPVNKYYDKDDETFVIGLEVVDDDGYICSTARTLEPGGFLTPIWREIAPFL